MRTKHKGIIIFSTGWAFKSLNVNVVLGDGLGGFLIERHIELFSRTRRAIKNGSGSDFEKGWSHHLRIHSSVEACKCPL